MRIISALNHLHTRKRRLFGCLLSTYVHMHKYEHLHMPTRTTLERINTRVTEIMHTHTHTHTHTERLATPYKKAIRVAP
jgi:hypothetical protein